jgi:hypothetical protein
MKKLIALTLAAASSLIAGSAMALPFTISIKADGGNAHPAMCYLIQNVGGLGGACDYECDIPGPYDRSPTLSIFFREQKVFLHNQCREQNQGQAFATAMSTVDFYGPSEIFDQWDYPARVLAFAGSSFGGTACLDGTPVPVGVLISPVY